MAKRPHTLLGVSAVLSVAVALLNGSALESGWYWKFWWFDIVMHFSGGALMALLALWVVKRFGWSLQVSKLAAVMLGAALIIGLAWEIFEYNIGFYPGTAKAYWEDTLLDMVMDVLGSMTIVSVVWINAKARRIRI